MARRPHKPANPFKRRGCVTPLKLWLAEQGIAPYRFCFMVGANPKQVYLWVNGQGMPSLLYAFKIDAVTKGGVPVSSWLGTERGRWEMAHLGSDLEAWMAQQKANHRKYKDRRVRATQQWRARKAALAERPEREGDDGAQEE